MKNVATIVFWTWIVLVTGLGYIGGHEIHEIYKMLKNGTDTCEGIK